jgi:hypothetical protein
LFPPDHAAEATKLLMLSGPKHHLMFEFLFEFT